MISREEQLSILNQVQRGEVSPEEAVRLLEGETEALQEPQGARWFLVRITDLDTGKEKISVRLPLDLVSVGARLGARYVPDDARFDLKHALDQGRAGYHGRVFDTTDEREREYIEISVE